MLQEAKRATVKGPTASIAYDPSAQPHDREATRTATSKRGSVTPTLGQYLASIRTDRRLTLRQVEEATDRRVSNAYLSQIENDKIQKPSPNILHSLAEIYGISFENLMDKAGYLMSPTARGEGERHTRVATFSEHDLTPQEESELVRYLQFLRSRKPSHDET